MNKEGKKWDEKNESNEEKEKKGSEDKEVI
jgi:hypothetical protein